MTAYIIRRLLWAIPVLIIISLVTFGLEHSVPGGPFDKEKALPEEIVKNLEAYYHLDQPLWKQYIMYINGVLHFDLGPSYSSRTRKVEDIIRDHFPVSFQLGMFAMAIALIIGIPLGIISALKQNTITDYTAMFFAILGVSVPSMVIGPFLIWIFALKLKWFPVARWGSFRHAVLPAITLGIGYAALLARLTRASMLQVIREDYIRTAKSKGLSQWEVIMKHALKNALIPVVTVLGPLFANLITGSMVVEQIFGIPGMGKYFVVSVGNRDYPVIMGVILLYGVLIIAANLIVDIAYAWIDPRIKYS